MTLSFSQKWKNGQPNFFIDKIWTGIYRPLDCFVLIKYEKEYKEKTGDSWEYSKDVVYPKIHTIREDKKGRWKVGNKINFVVNNRTKNRFQFAPVREVKSVQKIEIIHKGSYKKIKIDDKIIYNDYFPTVLNDGSDKRLIDFVRNDGFETVEQFFEWFNEDFKGKIIHWTDTSY